MPSPLTDLDELVLNCRDNKAKTYVWEAVASYRAGAFRAAIVGTWIAVCFDIIGKIHELSLSGDKEAEKQAGELDKTRKSADVASALKFERQLLELARDKFELLSPIEFVDLERLREDRNRCAHPALASDEQAYSPSAELARAHIHAAVTHLMQHPPAQGKYALDRLRGEIDSEYFPTQVSQAINWLSSGPLRKPRESLNCNFTLVLVKRLLKEEIDDWKKRQRVVAALRAVAKLHRVQYEATLTEKLSTVLRTLKDAELINATRFLQDIPDSWQCVEVDLRQRLQDFVAALPADHLEHLDFLLQFEPLRQSAESRVNHATRDELKNTLFFDGLPVKLADRYIELYLDSKSFDQANEWAQDLSLYMSSLSKDQIMRIVTSVQKNQQVLNSFELEALLNRLRSRKTIPEGEFDALLHASGLSGYALPLRQQQA